MEMQSSKEDDNVKALLDASVVEDNKEGDEHREVAADTGENNNEVTNISDGKKEVEASETSRDGEASGKDTPRVTRSKTKPLKTRSKKLVKRRNSEGTPSAQHGTNEDRILDVTTASNKKGEKVSEDSLGGNEEEVKKIIRNSAGDKKEEESSLCGDMVEVVKAIESNAETLHSTMKDEKVAEVESSENKTPKAKPKFVKTRLKRLRKVKNVPSLGTDKEGEEGVDLDKVVTDNKMDKNEDKIAPGGDEKVIDDSAKASENINSVEKKLANQIKMKPKKFKTRSSQLVKTTTGSGISQVPEKDNDALCGNGQGHGNEKSNVRDEGPAQNKSSLAEEEKQKQKRKGKQVKVMNKKAKNEHDAVNAASGQRGKEESNDKAAVTESSGKKKEKIGGLIFMCNKRTKPDCFQYSVMGVSETKKDFVMNIKPGLKLFLYDYDLKLLYGIFQASSNGGMKLERKAFNGSFPAQVRFKVFKECEPLPESVFRTAIKENYSKNKFKTELTPKQVFKLNTLFRPALGPSTHNNDVKRSEKDRRYASGSSRPHVIHRHDNGGPDRRMRSPRREDPHDLFLSEREYRTYGLRRGPQPNQHLPLHPPIDSYRSIERDRVALDPYHPPNSGREHVLRYPDVYRETRHLEPLYDHRHDLSRLPQPPRPISSVNLDPHYGYDYHANVPERPSRAYPPSLGVDEALYLRYASVDSLTEYYRTRRHLRGEGSGNNSGSDIPLPVTSRFSYTDPSAYRYR